MLLFVRVALAAIAIVIVLVVLAPAGAFAATCGLASYYGAESGSRTANGERFTGSSMTAASLSLPFGTRLRVTYRGRSVVVRVNDRGPYVRGRFLDLSRAAAARLGLIPAGVGKICVEILP